MRDGDLEDYDGYEGMFYISASNSRAPVLVDRRKGSDGKWLPSPKGQLYSGCYVNAVINVWAQDNKYGKRLNASIESVQFYRDGDPFGAKPVDPNEAFDDEDFDDIDEHEGFDDDDDNDLL